MSVFGPFTSSLVSPSIAVAIGVTLLYYRYFEDRRFGVYRDQIREVRRTGIPSGFGPVDEVALRAFPKPRSPRVERFRAFVGDALAVALPVVAAIVWTPWYLLGIPVLLAKPEESFAERGRRLREALANTYAPSFTLTPGDGSPPRPAYPAV